MSEYLFVYGTLKQGFCRAHYLQPARYLGNARTAPGFIMFNCGSYPALIQNHGTESIVGELYEVPASLWSTLDEVEGVAADWYSRKTIPLIEPHHDLTVQAYYYKRSITGLKRVGEEWT
ncbi:MAG: gamma-glutamylcyclotransferase [Planctomycetaceae bacterium]|nr:gamma-glutamylcyclotransferase [Planctomycetaceae bacterium]